MSYLAICWSPGDTPPIWLEGLQACAPPSWRVALKTNGAAVLAGGRWPPGAARTSWGLAIGEMFGEAAAQASAPVDGTARGRAIVGAAWGSYVALIEDARSRTWSVLRSPSGALDAVAWRKDRALLVASDLEPWMDQWAPAGLQVDWPGLARLVAHPAGVSAGLALQGLEGVAPGELWSPQAGRAILWSPALAARQPAMAADELREALPGIVDRATGALAGDRPLIELSGGLDSAIVAASLCAVGKPPVAAINYFARGFGGDERPFAREAAQRYGIELIEVEKPPPGFNLAALASVCVGVRPALNALDAEHDGDVARRCEALGVDSLVTGQGGDHVFFQAPTALIAADMLGAGLSPKVLAVLARRVGSSAWSVLATALRARLARLGQKRAPGWLGEAGRAALGAGAPAHPWLEGLEDLPPAKALQAASLAAALSLHGTSRRGAAARLRHPLLSQPVQEALLPVAVGALTGGGHDRALARAAFADRLPSSILERVGKGRLTTYYGRGVAAGLPQLRPLLLEGRLASHGLVDRSVLDAMLTREHLAWRGDFGTILSLAAFELWARAWEARAAALSERR